MSNNRALYGNDYKDRVERLQAFWETQIYKIYVVRILDPRRSRKADIHYIRVKSLKDDAKARSKAAAVALNKSFLYTTKSRHQIKIRLAHPETDLGCKWNSNVPNPLTA